VRLEASTKPHVHQKFEFFWTNIASTMGCPSSKNRPKKGLRPLGVNIIYEKIAWGQHSTLRPQSIHVLIGLKDSFISTRDDNFEICIVDFESSIGPIGTRFWRALEVLELSVKCWYPVCFPLLSPPHPLLYCVLNLLQPLYSQFWANSLVQYSLLRT
jgi:hypothetical protein